MRKLIAFALTLSLITLATAAWAQKPSVITKIDGAAYVVRSCATHDWLATWSLQSNGDYALMVVNGENGTKRTVTTAGDPGGLCWIPSTTKLLYCRGAKNDKVQFTRVTYYTYDVVTEKIQKLIDVNDLVETYILDPISSEDGSKTFHMTIAGTKAGNIPSFNIYDSAAGMMSPLPSEANIATDYDLSADGKRLFWLLHDDENQSLFIVGWDIAKRSYSDVYEFGASADPADDHALLRVQSTNNRAASLAASNSDPTLKLCTYDFNNINQLYIQPLHLTANEEIVHFDWKGRGDIVYALIQNMQTGAYYVEDLNVITGQRTRLLESMDPISFVEYSPNTKTYYYSVVDERGSNGAVTSLIRLR